MRSITWKHELEYLWRQKLLGHQYAEGVRRLPLHMHSAPVTFSATTLDVADTPPISSWINTALPLPPRHFIPLMSNTCPNFYHTSNFRYIIRPPFRLMDDINFMFLCSLLKSPIPLPLLSPFFSYLPAFCSSIPCDTPLKVLSTRNHQLQ